MKVKFKYEGNGEGYHGIPARDLSEDDWAQLSPEQRRLVANSPLYQPQVAQDKAQERKAKEDK